MVRQDGAHLLSSTHLIGDSLDVSNRGLPFSRPEGDHEAAGKRVYRVSCQMRKDIRVSELATLPCARYRRTSPNGRRDKEHRQ